MLVITDLAVAMAAPCNVEQPVAMAAGTNLDVSGQFLHDSQSIFLCSDYTR